MKSSRFCGLRVNWTKSQIFPVQTSRAFGAMLFHNSVRLTTARKKRVKQVFHVPEDTASSTSRKDSVPGHMSYVWPLLPMASYTLLRLLHHGQDYAILLCGSCGAASTLIPFGQRTPTPRPRLWQKPGPLMQPPIIDHSDIAVLYAL